MLGGKLQIRTSIRDHPAGAIGLLIALIVAVDVAVLVGIGVQHPRPNTLSYELAKACMQVLAVVVLGGVLSLASVAYQLRQQERQRGEDQRRDARKRSDALIRETLSDVLSSYHAVKRGRRTMQTWRWDPQQRGDLVETYDTQMGVINDAQLDFERLKRTAITLSSCGIDVSRLRNSYSVIEKYLNRMLDDWRNYRRDMVESPSQPHLTSERLARLDAFINDHRDFREGIAGPIGEAVAELQNALLRPD